MIFSSDKVILFNLFLTQTIIKIVLKSPLVLLKIPYLCIFEFYSNFNFIV
jgi:hypothetical protein